MTEGRRPGGLTALAVINFVFGGFSVIGLLVWVLLATAMSVAADHANTTDEHTRRTIEAWKEIGSGFLYVMVALSAASAFLLISSGVGYLKQSRFWGRTMGNVYALLSIATQVVSLVIVTKEAGGGFSLLTILFLVYPVLTLILLNTTFKEDFVR